MAKGKQEECTQWWCLLKSSVQSVSWAFSSTSCGLINWCTCLYSAAQPTLEQHGFELPCPRMWSCSRVLNLIACTSIKPVCMELEIMISMVACDIYICIYICICIYTHISIHISICIHN